MVDPMTYRARCAGIAFLKLSPSAGRVPPRRRYSSWEELWSRWCPKARATATPGTGSRMCARREESAWVDLGSVAGCRRVDLFRRVRQAVDQGLPPPKVGVDAFRAALHKEFKGTEQGANSDAERGIERGIPRSSLALTAPPRRGRTCPDAPPRRSARRAARGGTSGSCSGRSTGAWTSTTRDPLGATTSRSPCLSPRRQSASPRFFPREATAKEETSDARRRRYRAHPNARFLSSTRIPS